jgi:hypothetical protein
VRIDGDPSIATPQLPIMVAAVDQSHMTVAAFESAARAAMRQDSSGRYLRRSPTPDARRRLIRLLARHVDRDHIPDLLTLAFAEPVTGDMIAPLASIFTPEHRVGPPLANSDSVDLIISVGIRLLPHSGKKMVRDVGKVWIAAIESALKQAPPDAITALLRRIPEMAPGYAQNVVKCIPSDPSGKQAQAIESLLTDPRVDDRIKKNLHQRGSQLRPRSWPDLRPALEGA